MRAWKTNQWGMLVQDDGTRNGNDLDTPQRMGMYWLGVALRNLHRLPELSGERAVGAERIVKPRAALTMLECIEHEGDFMRSNNPASRGNYCDMMTRDQQTGIIAMLYCHDDKDIALATLKRLFWNNMKRGWFTNNKTGWRVDRKTEPEKIGTSWPDFAGFDNLSICLRAFTSCRTLQLFFMPLLCILDLSLLFGAIQYRWFDKKTEPLNFLVRCGLIWGVETPISWLAKRLTNPDDMAMRVERYMEREPHKAPPLHYVWTTRLLHVVLRG